jgi:hypothetical protein
VLLSTIAAGIGCGKVTPASDGGGSGGAPGSGGASGTGSGGGASTDGGGGDLGVDGGAALRCPVREPVAGVVCVREGAVCEYGADPRGDLCRTFDTCTGGHWVAVKPDPTTCPPFTDAGMCGKNIAATACTAQDAYCELSDGRSCHCTNCLDGPTKRCTMDYVWRCQTMNTTSGCPTGAPDIGTACTVEGLACAYGCGMRNRQCDHGEWISTGDGVCPVAAQ